MSRNICLLIIVLLLVASVHSFSSYMVRKGGRLERLQRRTISEWKKAHHRPRTHGHRSKRRRHERDGRIHVDHVLAHMDSFVRPRFGRSVHNQ